MPKKQARNADSWNLFAKRRLAAAVRRALALPRVRRLGPKAEWKVGIRVVGSPEMIRLNSAYRRKRYATDVLSFPAPEVFREVGYLGELVICLPVLKRQAREQKHSAEAELEVLLAHGVLHLLGLDHEKGAKAAAEMARWETRLLEGTSGLIARQPA